MNDYYFVKQGECLSSLAKRFGFLDYRTIYDHPNNSELKKNRQNPNVIYPGDAVYIPENRLKEVDAATDRTHKFVLKENKTLFRLVVKDDEDKPFANVQYELKVDDKTFKGTTDDTGKIEQRIPANAETGGLILFSENDNEQKITALIPLKLGHLDPVEETTGVQSRLNNLGFDCGEVDDILGEKTKEALRRFQEKNCLPVTREADSATREKLRLMHDWQ